MMILFLLCVPCSILSLHKNATCVYLIVKKCKQVQLPQSLEACLSEVGECLQSLKLKSSIIASS